MIALREVVTSLYGAARLIQFKPDGLTYFDSSLDGFWRSFTAALLVAPLYGILMVLRADAGDGLQMGSALLGWLAYARRHADHDDGAEQAAPIPQSHGRL